MIPAGQKPGQWQIGLALDRGEEDPARGWRLMAGPWSPAASRLGPLMP